jgi:hypothetical protein
MAGEFCNIFLHHKHYRASNDLSHANILESRLTISLEELQDAINKKG